MKRSSPKRFPPARIGRAITNAKATVAAICVMAMAPAVFAADAKPAGDPVSFERDIKPLFAKHCFECHDKKKKGGLRLSNRREAFMPADSGVNVILPGKADDSLLIEVLVKIATGVPAAIASVP